MIGYGRVFTVMHTEKGRSPQERSISMFTKQHQWINHFGSLHYWSVGMYVTKVDLIRRHTLYKDYFLVQSLVCCAIVISLHTAADDFSTTHELERSHSTSNAKI